MAKDIIIPVEVGGITFKNPFYVASGPTTKTVRQLQRIEETGWAAASIKLSIDPEPYINRKPRYAMFNDRNALAFTTEKRLNFVEGLKLVEDSKKVLTDLLLMANITYAGDEGVSGWVNMAKKFEEVGADIIELNMCCPNMSFNLELTKGSDDVSKKRTGASLGQQGDAVAEIVREIKKNVSIPVFVKLTPEGGKIAQIAKSIYEAGADAVGGTSNRMAIPPINLDNPERAFYHLQDEISMSCYCGPWLKPLAQRDTYEMRKVNGLDPKIMMAGGVSDWKDAVELVMCGANLVGVCAETLISGYDIARPMIKGMKDYMDKHGYKDLSDFMGIIVPEVKTAADVTLYDGYAKVKEPNLSAPCKAACPHHLPAQAYIQKVAKGEYREAYDLITGTGPLQNVCSYVCNHPCEAACTRGVNGRPVQIKDIKRFVLDYGKKQGWKPSVKPEENNGHSVAVIGSGPAGLSSAYQLAKAGYIVTVFEKEAELGGMMRYAIPSYRLDSSVIDDEISLLKEMGVEFKTGIDFGKDITADSLKKEGYDAVFVAVGAQNDNMPYDKNAVDGILGGLDILKSVSDSKKISVGDRTVIIGDGFIALDSARTAVRLGAKEVILIPEHNAGCTKASAEEFDEAASEGVKIMNSVKFFAPVIKDSKLTGITLKNELIADAEFTLGCDTLIYALGQKPSVCSCLDTKENGFVSVEAKTLSTSVPGVFAGGDAVRCANVISAIAAGKKAAVSIDKYIRGMSATLEYTAQTVCVDRDKVLKRTGYFKDSKDGINTDIRCAEYRKADFDYYKRVLTEEEAKAEASRCLNCGCGEGCGLCKTICSDFAPYIAGPDKMAIEAKDCVACGMCFNRCPNGNIEMVCTNKKV